MCPGGFAVPPTDPSGYAAASPPSSSALAARLGLPVAAIELVRSCDVVDLHLDALIPARLWGYDLHARHDAGLLGGRLFGHLDLPRIADIGLTGAMWSITTNPLRSSSARWRTLLDNLAHLRGEVNRTRGRLALVRDLGEYQDARRRGAHAVLVAIQGGNALQAAPDGPASVPDRLLTRVTLVHLTSSVYGTTSSPLALRRNAGLTAAGRVLVERLDAERVFVDLAHLGRRAFWDAVEAHDRSLPLIVTHTGVNGVRPHWRNLDDDQIRAIAATGGVVGILFHEPFLSRKGGPDDGRMVLEHVAHVIDVAGEDAVAIGSDYDGAIVPPVELRDGYGIPRIVAHMLAEGWSHERIVKLLGANFLAAFGRLRPGPAPIVH